MAKTAAKGTISPFRFVSLQDVVDADVLEVAQQVHYTTCNACPVLLSGYGPSAQHIFFDTTSYRTKITSDLRLNADWQSLTFSAECVFPASYQGTVRITIGSASDTLTFDNGDNGTRLSTSLAAGDIGAAGWHAVTIETIRDLGFDGAGYVLYWRIQVDPIAAADLPDPGDD